MLKLVTIAFHLLEMNSNLTFTEETRVPFM